VKIYIATSWKIQKIARATARTLREDGHEVDCFCDSSTGRYTFDYHEFDNLDRLNAIDFLKKSRVQKAFEEDKRWIDWADAVVMIAPCGASAHLEAGYAKGSGKKLYILGGFPVGWVEVMYGFADGLFRFEELGALRDILIEKSLALDSI